MYIQISKERCLYDSSNRRHYLHSTSLPKVHNDRPLLPPSLNASPKCTYHFSCSFSLSQFSNCCFAEYIFYKYCLTFRLLSRTTGRINLVGYFAQVRVARRRQSINMRRDASRRLWSVWNGEMAHFRSFKMSNILGCFKIHSIVWVNLFIYINKLHYTFV